MESLGLFFYQILLYQNFEKSLFCSCPKGITVWTFLVWHTSPKVSIYLFSKKSNYKKYICDIYRIVPVMFMWNRDLLKYFAELSHMRGSHWNRNYTGNLFWCKVTNWFFFWKNCYTSIVSKERSSYERRFSFFKTIEEWIHGSAKITLELTADSSD